MKLYHFTSPENLFGISLYGLTPVAAPPELGITDPVVWLTTQEDLQTTEQDLAFMKARPETFTPADITAFSDHILLNKGFRLMVNLPPNNKRLAHYLTWLQKRHPDHEPYLPPSARDHWWIYFGTIPLDRIALTMTLRLALPGIEDALADAIKEGDPERIKRLTKVRDQVKAEPLDDVITYRSSNTTDT